MMTPLELIASIRGGIPEKCDFCDQPYTDERHPEPEEAGAWACTECTRRWREREITQGPPHMITAEQIPDEVAMPIVDRFFQGRDPRGAPDYINDVKELIAAALNAWPSANNEARKVLNFGNNIDGPVVSESWQSILILPLPMEPRT